MEKIAAIFDLLGVITKESMFATNIIYPMVRDKISYDLFKKKYLLYAIGNIEKNDFWEFVCSGEEIKKIEERIVKETSLTPGVKNIMHDLITLGCELYLATEIPKRWGEMLLDKGNINNIFKKKFYTSDLLTTKPFAKFYEVVFKNIDAKSIYYIDDTLINLIAAQKIKRHNTVFYAPTNVVLVNKEISYKINSLKELTAICRIKK